MRNFLTINITILLGGPSQAFAHAGHVGELAGHAHWVGVAAVVAAATIAAILAKGKKAEDDEASDEEVSDIEQEAGESA